MCVLQGTAGVFDDGRSASRAGSCAEAVLLPLLVIQDGSVVRIMIARAELLLRFTSFGLVNRVWKL